MFIEKDGDIKPHGFHLGTDFNVAEPFVFEQLENGATSVALRLGKQLIKIYDWRDLYEYEVQRSKETSYAID